MFLWLEMRQNGNRVDTLLCRGQGVMKMRWMDRKPMSYISTFHDTMMAVSERGEELNKPRGVQED
jgi:hypothetical protein